MPRLNLHIDGAVIATVAIVSYGILGQPWWIFAALILAPDLFMLGYLVNSSIGARIYNIGHSKVWPAALLLAGWQMAVPGLLGIGLIWAAHIGIDHLFGYGFKYPDQFKHTHFTEI